MKILFLGREIPYPANSGVKMRTWHVLKELADRHELILICYGKEEDARSEVLHSTCKEVHVVEPLKTAKSMLLYVQMFFGILQGLPYGVKGRYSKVYDDKVKELLEKEKFDLVVSDSLYQAIYVPEKGSFKTLLNEHNIESVIIDRFARLEKNFLMRSYAHYELGRMKRFEDKVWQRFDYCFVCSHVDKDVVLKRVGSIQVDVIPNGVTLPKEKFLPAKGKNIVYTGLIGWRPNADAVHYFVREIYPLIKKEDPEVKLFIVGKGPSSSIQNYGQEDASITVTGFVDSVTPFIRNAAVMIVPLRIGSGTRLKILEALAYEKAVVSTSIGSEGLELVPDQHIVNADRPEDFAREVLRLLKDEEKRNALGQNGRALVEKKYTWGFIGGMIGKAIEGLKE